jgi:acetoin utilization deacetylase AcuC-like enzyme
METQLFLLAAKKQLKDAVGSIITAIDGVQQKEFKNAFCAVRPPGHHAEKDKAMGFCIYNNVAVGANYLIEKYKYNRVAIIDFDVHHGNGTQDIFYDNEKSIIYFNTSISLLSWIWLRKRNREV